MPFGNKTNSNILKYNTKHCNFQLNLYHSDKALSSVARSMYNWITPPGNEYLSCHSPNSIKFCIIHFNILVKQYKF